MTEQIQVSVADIRIIALRVLASLEDAEIEKVSLDMDYFWAIPPNETYDMGSPPTTFTVGQVTESLGWLEDVKIPLPTYSLIWLSDVLKAAGHSLNR